MMSSSAPPLLLHQLSAQRWLIPLLADLGAHDGARFAELVHRIALPRDSLVRALGAAQAQGWVVRNPGHGHPLRPEYLLTEAGQVAARRAAQISDAQSALGIDPGAVTRWGLPILSGIHQGKDRFNALSRLLAPASPRALSQGLVALGTHALIGRDLLDLRPPASRYWLTDHGAQLAEACLA